VLPFCFRYGAHLTKEQVAQLVAPHTDTLKLVSLWLGYNGVPASSISTTHGGGWLTVAGMPVSKSNELLGASYQLYYHAGTNKTVLRTVRYALPAARHIHVQTVVPTTAFMSMRLLQHEETPPIPSGGGANTMSGDPVNMLSHREPNELDIKPLILRALYRTVEYSPIATDQNKLGIVGSGEEFLGSGDLQEFMTRFFTDTIDVKPTIDSICVGVGHISVNANFNVQYALALAYPTLVIYYEGSSMLT
jgi:tripeptidyl-peptidase-1